MPFSLFITVNRLPTLCFFFHVFFSLLLILSYGGYGAQAQAPRNENVTNIGAIFDVNSPIGKEKKIAMEIAAQNFNKTSSNHKLALYFQDSGKDPFRTTSSAEKMIKEKKIDVVIGMDTWQEATLVAKVGNQSKVPVISSAAPSITPPLMTSRWPFLIAMDSSDAAQINCMADLVCAYNWRKVVVIYEDNEYSGDFGSLTLLNEALQGAGSEIEYRLVLPPYSSLSNPKDVAVNELLKVLINVQSRAFIVLRSSFPMVAHLFREANKLELVGKESVWIVTESITSLLDSFNGSVISSMEGILGIKTYHDESSNAYKDFYTQFNQVFQTENQQKHSFKPSIHALRAYDSVRTITQGTNITTKTLLENILSSNFDGLSGKVRFQEGMLLPAPIFRIVNVIGNYKEVAQQQSRYKELDFWMPQYGFLDRLIGKNDQKMIDRSDLVCKTLKGLNGSVVWPGNLNRKPKGWAMPSTSTPLRIGVPGRTVFKKFVEVDESKKDSNDGYDGFCIQIFKEVVKRLGYDLPYKFEAFNGTYPDLVDSVYNKTFDAVVGDVTILANRTDYVEFTHPYAESGLSLIVPVKSESAWMFMKPFTWELWVVMGAILIYTMFIVLFLEHRSRNPEFSGPLKNQIGIALWFIFCSLFYAHRERVNSNLTRVVVMVWLFVVFITSSSYTANLSSILTVRQLEQDADIESLKRTNQTIGCDGDSFVMTYLMDVLGFKEDNIIKVTDEYSYVSKFAARNISAAIFELPNEKVFLNKYCKEYTTTEAIYRFGGLGFVFQKGSPIARDVSRAILSLSEDGNLTALANHWLTPKDECSNSKTSVDNESLSLESFWGLYLISGAASTICFVLSLFRRNYQQAYSEGSRSSPRNNKSVWDKPIGLARYYYNGEVKSPVGMPPHVVDDEWGSSRWEMVKHNRPSGAYSSLFSNRD